MKTVKRNSEINEYSIKLTYRLYGFDHMEYSVTVTSSIEYPKNMFSKLLRPQVIIINTAKTNIAKISSLHR